MINGFKAWVFRDENNDYSLPQDFLKLTPKQQEQCMKHEDLALIIRNYLDSLPTLIKELY